MNVRTLAGLLCCGLLCSSTTLLAQQAQPTRDIQEIMNRLTGAERRAVRASDSGRSGVLLSRDGSELPWRQPVQMGTALAMAELTENFNGNTWRGLTYAYNGVTHFNNNALNFTYGGEGTSLIYEFNTPQVKRGGVIRFALPYGDQRSLRIGIGQPEETLYYAEPAIDGTRAMVLIPQLEPPVQLVFDASQGPGGVIDNLHIAFGEEPTATEREQFGLGDLQALTYDETGKPTLSEAQQMTPAPQQPVQRPVRQRRGGEPRSQPPRLDSGATF